MRDVADCVAVTPRKRPYRPVFIVLLWVTGLWLIGRSRHGLPWREAGEAPDSQPQPAGQSKHAKEQRAPSTARAAIVFAFAAVVTLVGGVVLERSGEAIAGHIGMTGVVFGATVLAAATSLPEISTGLASVKLGDYKLAFSDIFGGNAFLPVLFLVASLISGGAVLPTAHDTDIYLTGLGVFLTAVYLAGLIFRPRRQIAGRLGRVPPPTMPGRHCGRGRSPPWGWWRRPAAAKPYPRKRVHGRNRRA